MTIYNPFSARPCSTRQNSSRNNPDGSPSQNQEAASSRPPPEKLSICLRKSNIPKTLNVKSGYCFIEIKNENLRIIAEMYTNYRQELKERYPSKIHLLDKMTQAKEQE